MLERLASIDYVALDKVVLNAWNFAKTPPPPPFFKTNNTEMALKYRRYVV